jgi:hypothetical protein
MKSARYGHREMEIDTARAVTSITTRGKLAKYLKALDPELRQRSKDQLWHAVFGAIHTVFWDSHERPDA